MVDLLITPHLVYAKTYATQVSTFKTSYKEEFIFKSKLFLRQE